MRKTLLTALKHGSGTIFILLSMMLGGGLQVWGEMLPSGQTYYFHFTDGTPISTDVQLTTSDNNVYTGNFVLSEDMKSSYTFTIKCGDGKYYRNNSATVSGSFASITNISAYEGNEIGFTPRSGAAPVAVGVKMYCEYSKDSRLEVTQDYCRYFSAGEYIYFVNGTGYAYNSGTIGDRWIFSSSYAGIKLTMSDGTTQYAWFEYDASASGGKAAGEVGAVYKARIGTAGYCSKFVITRNHDYNASADPTTVTSEWYHVTSDLTYDATHVGYNTITNTTSGTGWTGNYTAYCNAPTPTTGSASSITTTTVTLGATVAAAASDPCTPTYVGVKVYSDASCETLVTSGQTAFVNYATTYSINITSLTPKTTYYYKAYAVSDAGTIEATISRNFTTDCLYGVNKETVSGSTSQNVCLGDATAISVSPSGALTYTYQWYYNNTGSEDGAVAIPGATSASYTPAVVGANYYFCAVGATGGYCDVNSNVVGAITVKAKPTLSVSQSSVTNYVPVTVTSQGAEIKSGGWSFTVDSGTSTKAYFYNEGSKSAKFKALTGSSATYTITGTTSNNCSGTATVTVTSDSDNCQ